MAAMTAYLTYGPQDMLAIAQNTWDYVSQYQITEDQAKQGQHPLRNVTFSHTCNAGKLTNNYMDFPLPSPS